MNASHLRADPSLSGANVQTLIRDAGAHGNAYLKDGDVLLWGSIGAVRRAVLVLGFAFDQPRRGLVQSVFDGAGRIWGEVTYGDEDNRASCRLCYAMGA